MQAISVKVFGPGLFRRGLEVLLARQPGVAVVPEDPRVAVLVGAAWERDLASLRGASPAWAGRAVLLTENGSHLLQAARLGVEVFLGENASETELLEALEAAGRGTVYYGPSLGSILASALRQIPPQVDPRVLQWAALSRKERAVAGLVAQGYTNAQVAARLGMRVSTVKFHLTNIFAKLGLEHRNQLILFLPLGLAHPAGHEVLNGNRGTA